MSDHAIFWIVGLLIVHARVIWRACVAQSEAVMVLIPPQDDAAPRAPATNDSAPPT